MLIWVKKTCSCRMWQLTNLPCRHACAAIAYQNQRPEAYAHNWLTMGAYSTTLSIIAGNVIEKGGNGKGRCSNIWTGTIRPSYSSSKAWCNCSILNVVTVDDLEPMPTPIIPPPTRPPTSSIVRTTNYKKDNSKDTTTSKFMQFMPTPTARGFTLSRWELPRFKPQTASTLSNGNRAMAVSRLCSDMRVEARLPTHISPQGEGVSKPQPLPVANPNSNSPTAQHYTLSCPSHHPRASRSSQRQRAQSLPFVQPPDLLTLSPVGASKLTRSLTQLTSQTLSSGRIVVGLASCLRREALFHRRRCHLCSCLRRQLSVSSAFIIGDGNNMYDFTYVGNVAHSHLCADRALASEGEVSKKAAGEIRL
ncbi:hypothetical protein Ahy_A06g029728 [Arachis hypogaea]|uniref:SWIM-type domain-containing protein n=1 Tax=Arachis hypogaea TaxID=3818 RepID=A0A445CU08_ARAHY|nr:hypothetical protein Ahy_A06g029728 [Arachis hypogaea]